MPRIYAINPAHTDDQPEVAFINGVAAVPAGANTAGFAAREYTVDTSRDALEVWDKLPVADLDKLLASFGITVSSSATKAQKVAAFEAAIPMDSLTVTVGEATLDNTKIKITITTSTGYTYYMQFLKADESANITRGAKPGEDWTKMTLTTGVQDEITVPANSVSVAVIGVKGGVALALATESLS